MPATTPVYGLPYLVLSDPPDIAGGTRDLALEAEAEIVRLDAADAALDVRLDVREADTGWVNVTTSGGFAIQDQPQVRKIGGIVFVRGGWSNTGMSINSTFSVGTLPAGFIPTYSVVARAGSSVGTAAATIFVVAGTGVVQVRTNGTLGAYYEFGGQVWLTD